MSREVTGSTFILRWIGVLLFTILMVNLMVFLHEKHGGQQVWFQHMHFMETPAGSGDKKWRVITTERRLFYEIEHASPDNADRPLIDMDFTFLNQTEDTFRFFPTLKPAAEALEPVTNSKHTSGQAAAKPAEKEIDSLGSLSFRLALDVAIQEQGHVIEKASTSLDLPLGNASFANILCRPYWKKPAVAIVGNGPLTSAQRESIARMPVIIRFNQLQNLQWQTEKTSVWISRYTPWASEKDGQSAYWGVSTLGDERVQQMLCNVEAVILLGGEVRLADKLTEKWPLLMQPPEKTVLLPEEPIRYRLAGELDMQDHSPSSGFIAIKIVQHCNSEAAMHIYGMNWSHKNWMGHEMDRERRVVQDMEAAGKVFVHTTPCTDLRECSQG